MKKRYIIIPLIIMGLILLVSPFIIRVNAANIYRRYYSQNFYSNYQEIIVLNYSDSNLTLNSEYPFLTFKFNDVDNPSLEITRTLTAKWVAANQYNIVVNGYDTNIPIYSTDFYLLHLYSGANNSMYIDFYLVDFNTENWRNNLFLQIVNNAPIYTYDVNLRWNEVLSGQVRMTYYGNIVSSYYEIPSIYSKWTVNQLNVVLKEIKQYPYDSDLLGSIYAEGLFNGYEEGQNGENAISPFVNIVTTVFSGIDSVLQIEFIPHIKLWYFVAIPLTFVILWGVFKIFKSH